MSTRTHLRRLLVATALFAIPNLHCSVEVDDSEAVDEDVKALVVCPGQIKQGALVRCTKTHPSAPFLRPSLADSLGTRGQAGKFYGAMLPPRSVAGEVRLFDRNGTMYLATDARGVPLDFGNPSPALKKAGLPTNRVYYTLYRFEGALRPGNVTVGDTTAPAFALTSATPIADVDGCAVDSLLLGQWEGTVTTRLSPEPAGNPMFTPLFDARSTRPLRVTFGSLAKGGLLADWQGGPMADQRTYVARGVIDNYADFAALGAKNPFLGSHDGNIDLSRRGAMHGLANDNHWVLTYPRGTRSTTTNGMSYEMQALSTASLLLPATVSAATARALRTVEVRAHVPYANSGFVITLQPKGIGSAAGNCPR